MRGASSQFIAALSAETTKLARLWRVTRADGTVLRFTDAVKPVAVGAEVYRSDISFTTSAIFTSRSFANGQSVTVIVVMDDLGISEKDLRARLYDDAVGEVMLVHYDHPEYGTVSLFKGQFGTVKVTDKLRATIEIKPTSATGAAQGIAAEKYSATCRATLGDSRCKVDIEALKKSFTVDTASGGSVVTLELDDPAPTWILGYVKWLTGDNAGTTSGVQSGDPDTKSIFLTSAPGQPVQPGDTGIIYPGCDKLNTTCRDKFNNLVNMRAEPTVPDGAGVPGGEWSIGHIWAGSR